MILHQHYSVWAVTPHSRPENDFWDDSFIFYVRNDLTHKKTQRNIEHLKLLQKWLVDGHIYLFVLFDQNLCLLVFFLISLVSIVLKRMFVCVWKRYDHLFFLLISFLQLHSDVDSGDGNIKYILSGEGAGTIFVIDDRTGNIHATKTLDREEQAQYTLTAQAVARDTNKPLEPPSEFIVKVQDINDNPPEFLHGPYHARVPEMSNVGEWLNRLRKQQLFILLDFFFTRCNFQVSPGFQQLLRCDGV